MEANKDHKKRDVLGIKFKLIEQRTTHIRNAFVKMVDYHSTSQLAAGCQSALKHSTEL
jgi:hypothetical protein